MGKAPFRRTAIAACGVAIAVAATVLASPAVAGTPATAQTAGTASATATSFKINPTTAALSLGIGVGISLAGYTNQVAQAEARAIDLGIIGSTLAGEGCDGGDPTVPAEQQPQALKADSRTDKGEKSVNEEYLPVMEKRVRVDSTPYAEANTTTAPLVAGGVIDLAQTHSRSLTHVTQGTREAVATVDVGGITIAGVLELSGLHWSGVYKTGAIESVVGSFTIGSLKVLGQALPTNDPEAAINTANTLLAPLGVGLTVPKPHVDAGILFVDPMKIRVYPSAQRDSIAAAVLGVLQPARERLVDVVLAQDCGNDTYVLVADIVLGSVTGAGSFALEVGGVQLKTDALNLSSFLNGRDPLTNVIGDDTLGGFDTFGPSTLGDVPTAAPVTSIGGKTRRPALVAADEGSRGGKLALVGLLGLLGLVLVAERDRRLMRRAQRLQPTEA